MAVDHAVRQAKRDAQLAYFVFEELAQRFEQFEVQGVRQAAHIVMRLDRNCLTSLGTGGFDDIRINCALSKPARVREFAGLSLEDFDELAPDNLALGLGIGHASELAHELGCRIDVHDADSHVDREGLHDLLGFVQSQQTVIDKHAGEAITDRAVNQRSGNRRIDATRQPEDDFLVTDLGLDPGYSLVDIIRHIPVAATFADFIDETGKQCPSLQRVGDFRMELHAVKTAILVGHRGDRAGVRGRHDLESIRQARDLVAVAHPDFQDAVAFVGAEIFDVFQ